MASFYLFPSASVIRVGKAPLFKSSFGQLLNCRSELWVGLKGKSHFHIKKIIPIDFDVDGFGDATEYSALHFR